MDVLSPPKRSLDVFLNVPFDTAYEKLFVALIATLAAVRLMPRCAIEFPERGEGQLKRILRMMKGCDLSIHDLSRPERFNMPFELGLVVALNDRSGHEFILMETRRGSLQSRLSDMRGVAPIVHGNRPVQLIALLMDNLGGVNPRDVERIYRKLIAVVPTLKANYDAPDIFRKTIFTELVSGAIEEAERRRLFENSGR
jgi:hypothetical protein